MAALFVSLGRILVPVAGTPRQLPVPAAINPPSCHAVIIESLSGNTGKVYIGVAGLNKTTLDGCLIVLPIPTANTLPTFSIALAAGANAIRLSDLWFDVDVGGDGVLVSALIA